MINVFEVLIEKLIEAVILVCGKCLFSSALYWSICYGVCQMRSIVVIGIM